MRTNSTVFQAFNNSPHQELRLVIKINYGVPVYFPSHDDIPNVPANNIPHCIQKISSTSQSLKPDTGHAEIGSMTFELLDLDNKVTTEIRNELQNGNGLKGVTVELYRGGAGMDWSDFRIEQTQIVDKSVSLKEGVYRVACADRQREMRKDLFDLQKTRLAQDFNVGSATLNVVSTDGFEACSHVASFADQPTGAHYYLKITYQNGFEVVRATGKTATTFTGVVRGLFGTTEVKHTLPQGSNDDRGIEIEEYVYLELPGPAMAYALLTGQIIGGGTIPWHLGVSPAFINLSEFENNNPDWFDSSDYTKGFIIRFQGLTKTSGKVFIEKEVALLTGFFMPIHADGKIGLKRKTGVLSTSDYVDDITTDDIIKSSGITHDLSAVVNEMLIKWAWAEYPGFKADYYRTNILLDANSTSMHGPGTPKTLTFKGLHNARHTFNHIRTRFDSLRDRFAGPPLRLRLSLAPPKNDLEVGDIVRVIDEHTQDYSGTDTLDRAFEIQRISINQTNGQVDVDLFGSSQQASPIIDDGAGANSELPDSWYTSAGTDASTVLSIDVAGFLTADGTLTGAALTRSIYYISGDFTVPAGRVLTITENVELRVRGHCQIDGSIVTTSSQNVSGYLGVALAGFGFLLGDGKTHPRINHLSVGANAGAHSTLPVLEVLNNAGAIEGMPADMRGSGGPTGGGIFRFDRADQAWEPMALGGSGGKGGGSLVIVSRGGGIGAVGEINTSGKEGTVGSQFQDYIGGGGGGGAPGAFVWGIDGSTQSTPILINKINAHYGVSPLVPGSTAYDLGGSPPWYKKVGKADVNSPVNLGLAAARVFHVPKSRDPYPDYFTITSIGQAGSLTFQQAMEPTNADAQALGGRVLAIGDIWYDADNGNLPHRYNGTSFITAQDGDIVLAAATAQQALSDAATAQSTADGKITSYFQITAPTGASLGDIWFDTDDGNRAYRYNGTAWVDAQDNEIAQAISDAQTAQSTADGKAQVHYQTTAPSGKTASDSGDLWIDTDDNDKLYAWTGSAWVVAQDWFSASLTANWTQVNDKPSDSQLLNNALEMGDWVPGSGTTGSFIQHGTTAENVREMDTGPFGFDEIIWKCKPDTTINSDGGWDYNFSCDSKKSYRFTAFVKVGSALNGKTYLGCHQSATRNLNGTNNTNPYFYDAVLSANYRNRWMLLVGFLFSGDYTITSSFFSGLYDPLTGRKVIDGVDFKMKVGVTIQRHRSYHSNNTAVSGEQWFARPRADEINGQEPSIGQLCHGAFSDSLDSARSSFAVFHTNFDSTDEVIRWVNQIGAGEIAVNDDATSEFGSRSLKIGNNAGNDQAWLIHEKAIPFDEHALYKVSSRVRQDAGVGVIHIGVAGVAENLVDFINIHGDNSFSSQHYFAADGITPPNTWITYTGYFKGSSTTVGGVGSDPNNPKPVRAGVKYFRPLLLANFANTTGVTYVDSFTIEKLPGVVSERVFGTIENPGQLTDGVGINQGNLVYRAAAFGLEPKNARDGDVITFSPAWDAIPMVRFLPSGLSYSHLLNGSQVQDFKALNLSTTGFTVSAKLKELAGTTTQVTDTGAVAGSSVDFEMHKSSAQEAFDDNYTFQFDAVVLNIFEEPGLYVPGRMSVGLYTNDGTGWVKRATVNFNGRGGSTPSTSFLNQTRTISVSGLTNHAGREFGLNIESMDLRGSSITLDSVKYTTATVPQETTATPAGAPDILYFVLGGN